jgi:hypothetical protein
MRKLRHTITILTCAAATSLLGVGAAFAQQAVTTAGAADALTAPATTQGVTDIFVGRNLVGPYMLSWKGIEAGSETILRDTRRLVRDQDYKLDPKTGILTFTTALRAKQIARVDYRYTPGKSAANATMTTPLQLNLFERGSGALSVNALYRPDAPGPANNAQAGSTGMMLLGFNGNAKLDSQSSLTSKLFLDAQGGNLWTRSGMQLAEKSKTSVGQFNVGFTRVGAGFKAGQETGLTAGRQLIEAAANLVAIRGIAASASFQQTTDLPEEGKGNVVTVLGQRVTGSLGLVKFNAAHTETTTDTPDGLSTIKTANRLQVDQKIGATTNATAVLEHNETATEDSRAVSQTSTLNVRSQPAENVSVQGTFQNRVLPSGAEDVANLKVEAAPTKTLKLSAALGEHYTKDAAKRSREAAFEYAPNGRVSLTGMVQVKGDGANEALARGFTASARPNRFLELSGGMKLRDTMTEGVADPTAPDTVDVKLSFGLPSKLIRLTGGYADNPEDEKGAVLRARNRSVGLQSTVGQWDLSGNYTYQQEVLTTRVNTVLDAKLGWRLARSTQIITSFRQAHALDQGLLVTDTYSIGLTHRVGSLFDLALSGVMTTTQKDGLPLPDPDYRAEAKLGIRF